METKTGHLTLPLQIKTRLHHHRTTSQHRTWCGGIFHDIISICQRCCLSLLIQRNCWTRHSLNHETLRRMGNGSSLWDQRNPRRKRQNIKNKVTFRRKTLSHRTHQSLPYNFRGRALHTSRQKILLPGINHQPRSQGSRRRWQPHKKGLSSLRCPTKRRLHIQINILKYKKGCLNSPNFISPYTRIRSMEPDGNRDAPSPMLPCTIRPSNVQN